MKFNYGSNPGGGPTGLSAILFDLGAASDAVTFGSLDFSKNLEMELWGSDTGLQDSWGLEDTGSTGPDGKGVVRSTSPHRYFKLIKTTGYGSMGYRYWGVTADSFVGIPIHIVGNPNSDNNTIVVDGGNWTGTDGSGNSTINYDRVWSDGFGANKSYAGLGAFKDPDRRWENRTWASDGSGLLLDFNPPIPFTTFKYCITSSVGQLAELNGTSLPCHEN